MEQSAAGEGESVESEFATTVKYLDLYLRQKTDLFLQNYVFEPFEALAAKLMFLVIVLTLFGAGTLIVLAGIILLLATRMPLYAALLIVGVAVFLIGTIIARSFFFKKIILPTPTATEMVNRGKA